MAASTRSVIKLSEKDIQGASLAGRLLSQLKIEELKFWLYVAVIPAKDSKQRQNT